MAIIQDVLLKLGDFDFYTFILPFILFSAVIYAVLRKVKIFGESALINGLVSMSAVFLVFGGVALSGVNLAVPLGSFFGQIVVIVLIITFGVLLAGLFFPNIFEKLVGWITGGGILWWMVGIIFLAAVTSGLFSFITTPLSRAIGSGKDIFILLFFIALFVAIVALVSSGAKK